MNAATIDLLHRAIADRPVQQIDRRSIHRSIFSRQLGRENIVWFGQGKPLRACSPLPASGEKEKTAQNVAPAFTM